MKGGSGNFFMLSIHQGGEGEVFCRGTPLGPKYHENKLGEPLFLVPHNSNASSLLRLATQSGILEDVDTCTLERTNHKNFQA